jgi:CHASE1-domain containing sensor protein
MKSLKRAMRLLGLGLLIILALLGVGVTGAVFTNKKEQDYDNEIKTELAEAKEDSLEVKDIE